MRSENDRTCQQHPSVRTDHRRRILKGAALAHALSEATGLPVVHHAVQRRFVPEVCEQLAEPILPLDIYMKKPWEITMEEDI